MQITAAEIEAVLARFAGRRRTPETRAEIIAAVEALIDAKLPPRPIGERLTGLPDEPDSLWHQISARDNAQSQAKMNAAVEAIDAMLVEARNRILDLERRLDHAISRGGEA